ncbi:MAG: restriction endonuclease subunit S [Endozoicomonas sp.]|uniref:restriction endonuclease subunit S n=1 Tax=Endozoicomonas sp. TaxID=1892382 RepID=UPI003D9B6A88
MSEVEALPEGWKRIQLKEAVDIHDYERSPINASERAERIKGKTESNLFPYYGATGQVGWIDEYLSNEESVLVGEDGAPFLDPYKDKAYIIRGKFWVNNHAHILRGPKGLILNQFICHQLNILDYRDYVSGSTRLKLTKSSLEKLPFVVCSESEQTRIIEKLEELLSDLDNGVAELKAAQIKLSQYRQSLLKSAVEGQLTAPWREQNQGKITETGQQLLERILKERRQRWEQKKLAEFAEKDKKPPKNWQAKYPEPVQPDTSELSELPEGWVWATMDQLITKIEAGKSFKCLERPPEGDEYGVVKVSAVTWGEYDENESKTCVIEKYVNSEILVKKGDFLFSRANTTELVGACVIAEIITRNVMLSDKIWRVSFAESQLKFWILQYLRGPLGRKQIEGSASGNQASMKNISQEKLRSFVIPIAPIEEINLIEESLAHAFGKIQATSEANEQRIIQSQAQRKNILKDAFSGKLVPQNPDDEPASVLLEKIQVERAARPKPSRSNSKKKSTNMKSISRKALHAWVESLKENNFDFDVLSKEFGSDYEKLKDIVFSELADKSPKFEQYFDEESGSMKFKKVKQ